MATGAGNIQHMSCHRPSGELPQVNFGLSRSQFRQRRKKLLCKGHHTPKLRFLPTVPSLQQLLCSLQLLPWVDKDTQDAECQKAFLYGMTGKILQ